MRLPDDIRERQNDVFGDQLRLCGLLAAAFHEKHGGVTMRFLTLLEGLTVHEAIPAPPQAPVEPLVWKQRASEFRRVCDIPPDECLVVTRYSADGGGRVAFERKAMHQIELGEGGSP